MISSDSVEPRDRISADTTSQSRRRGCRKILFFLVASLIVTEGCKRSEPEVALEVPGGGVGLLFQLAKPRDPQAMDAMATMVRKRLQAFGFTAATVTPIGDRRVQVLVPGVDERGAERIEQLILRPVSLGIAAVDPGESFFGRLKESLPAGGPVRVAVERVGAMKNAHPASVWYLYARDKAELERVVAGLTPPAGRRLAILKGTGAATAFLVSEPPSLKNPAMSHVRVFEDEAKGSVAVGAKLAKQYREPFADLVRRNLNRPLAILIDGELRAMPVVASKIQRGEIRIDPDPLSEEEGARIQAEMLAVSLKTWQLVGRFRLLRKQVTRPGA